MHTKSLLAKMALVSTQHLIQWVPWLSSSLGVKLPEREAGHSHPTSAATKIGGATSSFPNMSSWRNA
jgi:hypothetical protein